MTVVSADRCCEINRTRLRSPSRVAMTLAIVCDLPVPEWRGHDNVLALGHAVNHEVL